MGPRMGWGLGRDRQKTTDYSQLQRVPGAGQGCGPFCDVLLQEQIRGFKVPQGLDFLVRHADLVQVVGPMGMRKNKRPSLAKNVSTLRLSVMRSTTRCMPFENRWR